MDFRATKTPAVTKFMAALYFFPMEATKNLLAKINIVVSQSAVSNSLHQVVNIIIRYLGNRYVKLPRTPEEVITIKIGFFEKYNFPGMIGCIDGTLCPFFRPQRIILYILEICSL
jgi:hypothetical protein